MVSAEQKTGEQNVAQELKLWEVTCSQPDGGSVDEHELSWQSFTILVAGVSQDDARKEADKNLQGIVPHRIEAARSITTISRGDYKYRIKLEPVE